MNQEEKRIKELEDALELLTETLESHDAVSYDCDRSGDKYCPCLDNAVATALKALGKEGE